ncbi:MAG: hypothetical protein HY291_09620 [Planctomycetes bacterium]|nr:hypothetical protein [Planctomycetota bacterium]
MSNPQALQALIRRYRTRLAVSGALNQALAALLWGALGAIVLAAVFRIAGVPRMAGLFTTLALPLGFVAGAVHGWRRSAFSDYKVAKMLDARIGHGDRLANAVYWQEQPAERRSVFVELAIREGLDAAQNANPGLRPAVALPRQAKLGMALSLLALGWVYLLFPPHVVPAEEAVSEETAAEMQKIFKGLGELSSKDGEDGQKIKKLLEEMNISEDDMSRMTQAEIMRMLNEKGIQFKGGEKAKAFEAVKGALAQIDLIKQQMAEIEKKNNSAYSIKTKDGKEIGGTRIKTTMTDESILLEKVKQAAGIKQDESAILADLERESDEARKRAKEVRGQVGLQKEVSYTVDPQAVLKADERFQNDVRDAIKDPNGEAAQRVKKAYVDLAKKEIENGSIPPGTADKMLKWVKAQ